MGADNFNEPIFEIDEKNLKSEKILPSDPFLHRHVCISRLIEEYDRYGQLIVAYDYDNTVFDYYGKGHTFNKVIEIIRTCKKFGFHLTVFTSCNEDRYEEIKKYLKENNIPFDSINETPDYIPFKGRKVYYNILLDDRAGLAEAYAQLHSVLWHVKMKKHEISQLGAQDIDF